MKQAFQKYIYWLIGTIVLAAAVLCGLPKSKDTTFYFQIHADTQTAKVSAYKAEDGGYYVFLPSYADLEQTTVAIPSKRTISIGETELSDNASCACFELETEYDLVIDERNIAKLQFLRSANVATLHINTATGSMANVHQDKEYEEPAAMVLYTQDGAVDYLDENCKIKGRGNATWSYAKKPYTLTLSADSELLGMGSGTSWVLLADATDESNLHNKLVFDLAEHLGLAGTPDCEFVDLYLNGTYRGLYLLAAKVETGSTRLNIDTTEGDFLCKVDLNSRWQTLRTPLKTQLKRTVEISEPKYPTADEQPRMESLVNEMEQTILSGTDLSLAANFDLDSWVRRYLIDEISGNIDADLASSYFYYTDGKFFAGPVWDYDMTFGNSYRNADPCAFVAKNAKKSIGFASRYYGALYDNDSFRKAMAEIYREELLPWAERMLDTGISQLADSIETAASLNRLRWGSMYDGMYEANTIIPSTVDTVMDYLRARVDFLNNAWLEGTEYCTVQFEVFPEQAYQTASVPKGGLLETAYVDIQNTQWIVSQTGERFDPDQPVTEDLLLILPAETAEEAAERQAPDRIATREIVTVFSILILLGMFGWLLAADLRRRAKERRNTSEYAGTDLSS